MKTTNNDEYINALMQGISLMDVRETEIRMETAACLYDAIVKCGSTPKSLASALSVPDSTMDLWLSGTIDIPLEYLCEAEKALHVEINFPSAIYA